MVCKRWVETATESYIDQTSSLDHSTLYYLQEPTSNFFRILAGVAQPEVAEGCFPQRGVLSLQVGSHSGLPVPNWLDGHRHLPIFFHNIHLLLLLLLLLIYTGASLIDSSVKGQYITIGAFSTVTKGLLKELEDLELGWRVDTIQTTSLLRTAWILTSVLETCRDLLSLKLQWKTNS